MKFLKFLSVISLVTLILSACSSPAEKTYTNDGNVYLTGTADSTMIGNMIYIVDIPTNTKEDSTLITDCTFSFSDLSRYADSVQVKKLMVHYDFFDDVPINFTMPVVLEKGNITVKIGIQYASGGTLLNDRLNLFLAQQEAFLEKIDASSDMTKAKAEYSVYVADAVKNNLDNVLASYILSNFKHCFAPEEYDQLMKKVGNRYIDLSTKRK